MDNKEVVLPSDVLEEIHYSEDESPQFDEYLNSRKSQRAPQEGLTGVTKTDLLWSGWFVTCHAILTKNSEGGFQILHVQPNKMGSFLTFEQKSALEKMGKKGNAIVLKGNERSWFGNGDKRELTDSYKLDLEKVIGIETKGRWRMLYDTEKNKVWVDVQDDKVLRKYKGFRE